MANPASVSLLHRQYKTAQKPIVELTQRAGKFISGRLGVGVMYNFMTEKRQQ